MDLFLRYALSFALSNLGSSPKQPLAKASRNVALFILNELHFIGDAGGPDLRLMSKKVTKWH